MNARLPAPLAAAFAPAIDSAAILARCTVIPWIVSVQLRETRRTPDGASVTAWSGRMVIVEAALNDEPDFTAYVPEGAELLRAEVFPAGRFEEMSPEVRRGYRPLYRAFLMWRKAKAIGKAVEALEPWVDYDPISVDERVQRWSAPGVRYAGD